MNTIAVKEIQAPNVDTKAMESKIFAALEAGKKQVKRLSWLFERHPGFVEKNAWDEHLGLEVRRMRW
ncbi:MAG: hypothetical protein ACC663_04400 [Gammaproteobacteria bacterium]